MKLGMPLVTCIGRKEILSNPKNVSKEEFYHISNIQPAVGKLHFTSLVARHFTTICILQASQQYEKKGKLVMVYIKLEILTKVLKVFKSDFELHFS